MKRIIIVVAVLFASSCFSFLTGNDGKFRFAYRASSDVVDFNKPIAPGARLDLLARTLGSSDELEIASATSSNPDVLSVVEVHPSHVTVQGGTVGKARISIRTTDGLEDSVDMHVARPDAMYLAHSCTQETFAVYPANARIAIPYGLERGDQQPVIGYGFWPIRIRPSKSLELDKTSRDDGALYFKTGDARHRVAIRSTIDDAILGLALVQNSEVDGMKGPGSLRMVEGSEAIVGFEPTVGGVAFCQARVKTKARSLTPDICDATAKLDDDADENEFGFVRVKAKKYGICKFEAQFPEGNNGAGVTRSLEVPVGKFPKLGEDADEEAQPWWLAPLLALIAPALLLPLAMRWRR